MNNKNNTTGKPLNYTNYAIVLKGKYVLDKSKCAGFTFLSRTTVLWTNEIVCNDPDTLTITWIDNNTFITRERNRVSSNCPPKVEIYRVINLNNDHLVLKEYWIGWGKDQAVILRLHKDQKEVIN